MIKKLKWGLISLLVGVVAFTFIPTSMSVKSIMQAQTAVTPESYGNSQTTFVTSYLSYQRELGDNAFASIGGEPGQLTIVLAMAHDNGEWAQSHGGIKTDDQGNQTAGQTREIKGYVYHATASSQPNAIGFVNAQNKSSKTIGAYHAIVDANTGYVWQVAPWTSYLYHGNAANSTCIGVETCEPPPGVYEYGNSSHSYIGYIYDKAAYEEYVGRCYYSSVDLCAYLCEQYNIDPLGSDCYYDGANQPNIVTHDDVPSASHVDPNHLWNPTRAVDANGNKAYTEPLYTIEQFRQDVANAMQRGVSVTIIEAPYTTDSAGHRTYQNPN